MRGVVYLSKLLFKSKVQASASALALDLALRVEALAVRLWL